MVNIAHDYASKRECSVQEAVYHIIPELWLRKTFPKIQFLNSNLPEDRYRITKSEEELAELADNSTDIFKRNMLDRYLDRPNISFKGGRYRSIDGMCFAIFHMYYYVDNRDTNEVDNDSLPIVLDEQLMEQDREIVFPPVIPLMNSKEKLKCRKVRSVLRFPPQNKNLNPERYAHHLLMCYYPFRSEEELKLETYMEKLIQPDVLHIVNENKMIVEPYGDMVDEALENLVIDFAQHNLDAYAQQENDEVEEDIDFSRIQDDDEEQEVQSNSNPRTLPMRIFVVSDDQLSQDIRSLNDVQRCIFDAVKLKNSILIKQLSPLHIFLTGGGGCGKSHLPRTMYKALTLKVLMHKGGEPDKPRVLRIAPTGVAAINISGTTIHTALSIHGNGLCGPLSSLTLQKLRNLLCEVEAVIIDEVSMVSGMLLLNIHLRLCQILGVDTKIPIIENNYSLWRPISITTCVIGTKVFQECPNNMLSKVLKLWKNFTIAYLTEVMQQKGDDVLLTY